MIRICDSLEHINGSQTQSAYVNVFLFREKHKQVLKM